jgi:hypothetical protein
MFDMDRREAHEAAVDAADATGRPHVLFRRDGMHGRCYNIARWADWDQGRGNAMESNDDFRSRTLEGFGYCVFVLLVRPAEVP